MKSYEEFAREYNSKQKRYLGLYDERVTKAYHQYFKENAEPGDGATVCLWTDREAYTIIKRTPCSLTLRRCKATLKPTFKPEFIPGGFSAHCVNQDEQDYDYEEDENGRIVVARWSKRYNRFRAGSCNVVPGRREYYDWNF